MLEPPSHTASSFFVRGEVEPRELLFGKGWPPKVYLRVDVGAIYFSAHRSIGAFFGNRHIGQNDDWSNEKSWSVFVTYACVGFTAYSDGANGVDRTGIFPQTSSTRCHCDKYFFKF